nr:aminoglycoside phosphotransferase family protein [Actinoplanes ianthinogenes]
MRDQPAPLPSMPSVLDWLRDRLEDDSLTDLRPGTSVAPLHERQAALAVLDDLVRDHVPGLCHGDASSGNIIASGNSRRMYIDPRGVAGEHVYDVAVLSIRVAQAYAGAEVVAIAADIAGVAEERLRAWVQVASAARV